MSQRKVLLLVLLISVAVSLGVFFYAQGEFQRLVASRPVVVALEEIPPYSIITPEMLTTKEMARTIERENVYLEPVEVAGKITTMNLPAGALIYRDYAVPMAEFHICEDERLEVVSFPVRPDKAVGGQLRINNLVNVYRIAVGSNPPTGLSPDEMLARRGSAVELLAANILVKGVRTGAGEPGGEIRPTTTAGQAGQSSSQVEEGQPRYVPIQILTVCAPPATVARIVGLMGETKGPYDFWVTMPPPIDAPSGTPSGTPSATPTASQ